MGYVQFATNLQVLTLGKGIYQLIMTIKLIKFEVFYVLSATMYWDLLEIA
jgi:hypothetical protein